MLRHSQIRRGCVITRHNDLSIVALLVIVVGLMILPLPTPLVDAFIG